MNAAEYVSEVLRTCPTPSTEEASIFHPSNKTILLGLRGESGEVADLIKKVIGHGHELDREKLIKELGDVLWYTAAAMVRLTSGGLGLRVAVLDTGHTFTNGGDLATLADLLCDVCAELGHAEDYATGCDAVPLINMIVGEFGRRLSPPVSISEIWEANVAKLRKRYPEGFTTEASKAKADEPKPDDLKARAALFFRVKPEQVTEETIRIMRLWQSEGRGPMDTLSADVYATPGKGYKPTP